METEAVYWVSYTKKDSRKKCWEAFLKSELEMLIELYKVSGRKKDFDYCYIAQCNYEITVKIK